MKEFLEIAFRFVLDYYLLHIFVVVF